MEQSAEEAALAVSRLSCNEAKKQTLAWDPKPQLLHDILTNPKCLCDSPGSRSEEVVSTCLADGGKLLMVKRAGS